MRLVSDSAWVRIFNSKDPDGWVAKFEGKPLGENPDSTFRVTDGKQAFCTGST